MNIFALDINPREAAKAHCDAHVCKMILETAQVLSAVWHKSARLNDYPHKCTDNHLTDPQGVQVPDGLYKATHQNHPCTVWAGATNSNYGWLVQLGFALCDEYTHRYGKTHKSESVLCIAEEPPHTVPHGDLTPFALAMPEAYRCDDGVAAYRAYYGLKASTMHRFNYTNRQAPDWLVAKP